MCRPPLPPIVILLTAAACLTGCSDPDPYARPGTWRATGINEQNLTAMLADPGDAVWGVSQIGTDGQLAAGAVTRLRTGLVKPLSTDSLSKVGGTGGGAAQNAAATPASAGAN